MRVATAAALIASLVSCRGLPPRADVPAPLPDAGAPDAAVAEPPDAGTALDAGTPDAGRPLELPPSPADPLAAMYTKRLDFKGGEPHLAIRLMEGSEEVELAPRGRMRLRANGEVEKVLEAPAGTRWFVRVTRAAPAELIARVQLAEAPFQDRPSLAEEQRVWQERGLATRIHTLGGVYGIAGKVIDNRRLLLLLDEPLAPSAAKERQATLMRTYGVRTMLFEEVLRPPRGILEVLDAERTSILLAQDRILAETLDGAGFDVSQVEFGVGYAFHGFEDRSYRGGLQLSVAADGNLAVVNLVPLEELLKGLVPSEIFARAHPEALKAQAVTARGEVLAKIGTKHLADPYLLCSEQHCAVYKGRSGEAPSTTAAVEATRGEGLFSSDGHLVDSVYSAVCGGHTENNDVVWGGVPNPSLRGRPDLLPGSKVSVPKELPAFLRADLPMACRVSTFAQPSKYRWEKRFTQAEVDALTKHLGIGSIRAISVADRGVSGRARLLTLAGERGATQIRGELTIRKLFGMLNSAMVVVSSEKAADGSISWIFRGGGWGHGVGMCQTGAIGRAEAGADYREILRHYFNGAEVAPIY